MKYSCISPPLRSSGTFFMLSYTSSAVVTALSCSPQGARLKLQHEKALTTAQPTEMLCALPRQADTSRKMCSLKHLAALWLSQAFCTTKGLTWSRLYTHPWMKQPLRSSLWDTACTSCPCLVVLRVAKEEKTLQLSFSEFLSGQGKVTMLPHPPTSPPFPKSFPEEGI